MTIGSLRENETLLRQEFSDMNHLNLSDLSRKKKKHQKIVSSRSVQDTMTQTDELNKVRDYQYDLMIRALYCLVIPATAILLTWLIEKMIWYFVLVVVH